MFPFPHAIITAGVDAYNFSATISSDTQNYNLRAAAVSAGWDQVKPLNATVTINSGVVVGSSSTGSFAFDTGASFPAGSVLSLTNNGSILGRGGDGVAGAAGGAGGPAFRAQVPINFTNNGTVGGGGGAGGSGAAAGGYYETGGQCCAFASGEGGCDGCGMRGSYNSASGGLGGGGAGYQAGSPSGTQSSGGTGSSGGSYLYTTGSINWQGDALCGLCYRVDGGVGNYTGYAASGANGGSLGSAGGNSSYSGGAAGACTSGNANITWLATGTRYGALN